MAEQHDFLWALMEDEGLSAAAKCVATVLILKYRNHETGVCNPSFATLGQRVGRKRRSVIDAVNELRDRGWCTWTGTLGGSKENTNYFMFDFGVRPVQRTAPVSDTAPVQSTAPTGAAERTPPVQYTAHEPSIKPSKNQGEGARTRATLIPDDFKLSGETYDFALGRLGSHDAVLRSKERFVDYYRQVDGPHAKSRDWQAKARLWFDGDAKAPRSGSVIHAADRLLDKVRSFDTGPGITDAEWDGMASTFAKFSRWNSRGRYGPPPSDPACIMPERFFVKHKIPKVVAA